MLTDTDYSTEHDYNQDSEQDSSEYVDVASFKKLQSELQQLKSALPAKSTEAKAEPPELLEVLLTNPEKVFERQRQDMLQQMELHTKAAQAETHFNNKYPHLRDQRDYIAIELQNTLSKHPGDIATAVDKAVESYVKKVGKEQGMSTGEAIGGAVRSQYTAPPQKDVWSMSSEEFREYDRKMSMQFGQLSL